MAHRPEKRQGLTVIGWDEFVSLTRERLHLRRGEYPKLADSAGVSLRWVRSFAAAEYPGTHTGWVFALAAALDLPAKVVVEIDGVGRLQSPMPRRA